MITQEYRCPSHGLFELREPCNEEESPRTCPRCGASSPYSLSAPAYKPSYASVTRGKDDERPPGALDTRDLGDGMPMGEWRAKQREIRQTEAINEAWKELKS